MSKIDLVTVGMKVVDVKALEYGKVLDSPAKCAHYSGFLGSISKDMTVPEDCLICPKILQCGTRGRQ